MSGGRPSGIAPRLADARSLPSCGFPSLALKSHDAPPLPMPTPPVASGADADEDTAEFDALDELEQRAEQLTPVAALARRLEASAGMRRKRTRSAPLDAFSEMSPPDPFDRAG